MIYPDLLFGKKVNDKFLKLKVLNNKKDCVCDAAAEHGKGLWDGVLKT